MSVQFAVLTLGMDAVFTHMFQGPHASLAILLALVTWIQVYNLTHKWWHIDNLNIFVIVIFFHNLPNMLAETSAHITQGARG